MIPKETYFKSPQNATITLLSSSFQEDIFSDYPSLCQYNISSSLNIQNTLHTDPAPPPTVPLLKSLIELYSLLREVPESLR